MLTKALVLLGSPRPRGSSESLARHFMAGAEEGGLPGETICLREKRTLPCTHCGVCERTPHACALAAEDDAEAVLRALEGASLLLVAAPIHFYALPGQLKCLIDRAQSRWARPQDEAARAAVRPTLALLTAGRPRGERLFAGSELCLSYFAQALGRQLTECRGLRGIESPADISLEQAAAMRDWGRQWAARLTVAPSLPGPPGAP
ncbi:NAD(P)H-dependent oxidoreductase [uncultured Desulfovibrio sp.]|uniref:NAD(P)H-dependent oxidoreductase n=1 Tax=Candidatus Desulfovibrio intestinavium TaxID=2838534 RepID=A0A9D2HNU5_9BACT|nr:NAD(P)H-dependent oxidoreductase [uncultured Desulfovibrio sp.]HJA80096.1 NAD(P)H-dependent oxidoreductase [Candidatus Desulfovibrio intestinavium]